ncbi:MAG TPA: hypothetical protein VNQ80_18960 [Parapedobacter sp.]|uniref:hypothetical protein n=1 Tax=Parapedobacter sp. TaxID=1958893 RepID=UPI002D1D98A1|nr:hypothetical protein [Parapedobacter sp.]HWK59431.1 hypothetical protein [Parapedobacter sp.]
MAPGNKKAPFVPEQKEGKQVDLESRTVLPDNDRANDFLQLVKSRLLNINQWDTIASVPVATFVLTDAYGGEAIKSRPKEGDHVRIDIPGPGPAIGDGYDWVVITDITDVTDQFCAITLQPAQNPLKQGDDIGHFFQASASSTLVVERKGHEVIARYHGRNEVTNTHTDSTLDNIRNTVVGISAKLGLSYPQWQGLLDGLLEQPNEPHVED